MFGNFGTRIKPGNPSILLRGGGRISIIQIEFLIAHFQGLLLAAQNIGSLFMLATGKQIQKKQKKNFFFKNFRPI